MSAKKKGLGMNNALGSRLKVLGLNESRVEHTETQQGAPVEIAVDAVHPNPKQPRRVFQKEALEALASSIRQYGVIQPIVVQKKEAGRYELIAGERRLRAAKLCGLVTIPAVIRSFTPDKAAEIALIENLQREDLDAIEEGAAYQMLIEEFHLTQEQAAEKVGKSRAHVANMMRLLQLPDEIKQCITEGRLSMGQARPLLRLTDAAQQHDAAIYIMDHELSARQVEAYVKKLLTANEQPKEPAEPDAYLEAVQDRMKMHLGTSVAIRLGRNKKKGKIEIAFTSEEELERLLHLLADEEPEQTASPISSFHV